MCHAVSAATDGRLISTGTVKEELWRSRQAIRTGSQRTGLDYHRYLMLHRTLVPILLLLAARIYPAWAESPGNRADLSRLVVIGDSLSAGFQNGSLLDRQQAHGYAAIVAMQSGAQVPLPLIAEPGIPNVLTLVDPGPPPVIIREPGISPGRLDPTVQVTNLAVPGANVEDALTTRPDCLFNDLTDLILGLPEPCLFGGVARSQVEWAEALAPTSILVWLGSNDTLGAAIAADASLVTPINDFKVAYAEVMDRLSATGAKLVVANIPDVTAIPFLTPAEEVAAFIGLPLSLLEPILGIGPGDFVTPDAFDCTATVQCIPNILFGISAGPLPSDVVLDAGEVAVIRLATEAFNTFIAQEASEKGAALVDIHSLLNSLEAKGVVVGGQRLTTAFLGGLFSLDGVHPTNTGYALIAKEFIMALNTEFAAGIPPVSLERILQTDPLVLPGVGHPASAHHHVTAETAQSLRELMVHE